MQDLDQIRAWIMKQPANPSIRKLRLHLFDLYRYGEEYEKIYQMIEDLTNN